MVMSSICLIVMLLMKEVSAYVRYESIRASRQLGDGQVNNMKPILHVHRLSLCPNNDNFLKYGEDCERNSTSVEANEKSDKFYYGCSSFAQECTTNVTVKGRGYNRTCTHEGCTEYYEEFSVTAHPENCIFCPSATRNAEGKPKEVIAECIPGGEAIRDGCHAAFVGCTAIWEFNPGTDDLTSCVLYCNSSKINCFNFSRSCQDEVTYISNVSGHAEIRTDMNEMSCMMNTSERLTSKKMVWSEGEWTDEKGFTHTNKARLVDDIEIKERNTSFSWEKCRDATRVPYNLQCNQFVDNLMDDMEYVFFEPHAHNLSLGIQRFLRLWPGGYEELCKWQCFYHLIKFSRECWPYLPLQRFLPGADYRQLELLLRNMTRIACYQTKPSKKALKLYDDANVILNETAEDSCAVFFDPSYNFTKLHYHAIEKDCKGVQDKANCSGACIASLNNLSEAFGCCLGSIVYQYNVSIDWLKHFNFDNQPLISKVIICNVTLAPRCDAAVVSSISIDIVTYLMYVIGGFMGIVVIIMTISFYWQLEHEPVKKNFFHF